MVFMMKIIVALLATAGIAYVLVKKLFNKTSQESLPINQELIDQKETELINKLHTQDEAIKDVQNIIKNKLDSKVNEMGEILNNTDLGKTNNQIQKDLKDI